MPLLHFFDVFGGFPLLRRGAGTSTPRASPRQLPPLVYEGLTSVIAWQMSVVGISVRCRSWSCQSRKELVMLSGCIGLMYIDAVAAEQWSHDVAIYGCIDGV